MENENQIDYKKALAYWADIPATLDGVLGGFGFISDVDISGSKLFLKTLFALENGPNAHRAVDCGAGIGRITKYLLIPHFQEVDIIEPDEKFLNTISDFVGEDKKKIGRLYKVGLQEFETDRKYDVFWNQWVLGYLTDEDLISYLVRCRNLLTERGVIVVKENVTSTGQSEMDTLDSSVTRSLKQFLKIFKAAKLKRIKQCKQTNFPHDRSARRAVLVDVTIPHDENLVKAEKDKLSKYLDLACGMVIRRSLSR